MMEFGLHSKILLGDLIQFVRAILFGQKIVHEDLFGVELNEITHMFKWGIGAGSNLLVLRVE